MGDQVYRVIIYTMLDNSGVKSGQRDLDSTFSSWEQRAQQTAQRNQKAFESSATGMVAAQRKASQDAASIFATMEKGRQEAIKQTITAAEKQTNSLVSGYIKQAQAAEKAAKALPISSVAHEFQGGAATIVRAAEEQAQAVERMSAREIDALDRAIAANRSKSQSFRTQAESDAIAARKALDKKVAGFAFQTDAQIAQGLALKPGDLEKVFARDAQAAAKLHEEVEKGTQASQKAIESAAQTALGAEHAITNTTSAVRAAEAESQSLSGIWEKWGGVATVAAGGVALVGTAAVATGAALFKLTDDYATTGRQIALFSEQTGLNAENVSALRIGALKLGKDLDSLSTPFNLYLKNLSEAAHGNKTIADTFARFGISAQQAKELLKDPNAAIEKLISLLGSIDNPAERADAAFKLAGRGAKDLALIAADTGGSLSALRKIAEEMGQGFSEKDVEAAKKFEEQLALLKLEAEGVGYKIAQEVLPGIQEVVEHLTGKIGEGSGAWKELGKDIGDFIKNDAVPVIDHLGLILKGLKAIAEMSPLVIAIKFAELPSADNPFKGSYFDQAWNWLSGRLSGGFGDKVGYVDVYNTPSQTPQQIANTEYQNLMRRRDEETRAALAASGNQSGSGYQSQIGDVQNRARRQRLSEADRLAQSIYGDIIGAGNPLPTSGSITLDARLHAIAQQYGLPDWLVFGLIGRESSFKATAVSPKGALGIAQFMPATGAQYGLHGRADFFNTDKELNAFGQYFDDLLARYNGNIPLALVAYNAGEKVADRVQEFIKSHPGAKGDQATAARLAHLLPKETQDYLSNILQYKQGGGGDFGLSPGEMAARRVLSVAGITPTINERGRIVGYESNRALATPVSPMGVTGLQRVLGPTDVFQQNIDDQLKEQEKLLANRQIMWAEEERRTKEIAAIQRQAFDERKSRELDYVENAKVAEARLHELLIENSNTETVANRRVMEVSEERLQLTQEIAAAEDEYANMGASSALKYQLAWQKAINSVRQADEDAISSQIQSHVKLYDQTVYHAGQANAKVLEFLASQRSVTDVIADAKIGVIQSTYDLIDRGLDKITSKLGLLGSVIKDLISGFARLALNQFFKAIYGDQGGISFGGQQSSGGGFSLGGLLSNLFGGIFHPGTATTPGFNPNAGAFNLGTGGSFFTGNAGTSFFGSGLASGAAASFFSGLTGAAPAGQSVLPAPVSIATSTAQQTALQRVLGAGGSAGTASRGFSLSSLGAQFGALAPLLGLSLGASLGGPSLAGNIVGGLGGLIAGGTVAAFSGALGPTLTAILTSPVGIALGPLLLIGASLLGRNAERRRNETTRDQLATDIRSQLYSLIAQVNSDQIDGPSALQQYAQARAQYLQSIAGFDSKTKRNATLWLQNDLEGLVLPKLYTAIDEQEKRKARVGRMSPEFASGGAVWQRFADGGMMQPFAGRVPGVYNRMDDKLIRVSGNEVVLNPAQWMPITPYLKQANVPGFANGGAQSPQTVNTALPELHIDELQINIDSDGMAKVVIKSNLFKKAVVHTVNVNDKRK